MKKYYLGMIAILLTTGLMSYTSNKQQKSFDTLYKFVLIVSPTGTNIQAISTESGIDYYINWEFVGTEDCIVTCDPGEEIACTLLVHEKYIYDFGGEVGIRLLAEDPDGNGPKKAFPMCVENGIFKNGVQYKKVCNSIEIHCEIEVENGTID